MFKVNEIKKLGCFGIKSGDVTLSKCLQLIASKLLSNCLQLLHMF